MNMFCGTSSCVFLDSSFFNLLVCHQFEISNVYFFFFFFFYLFCFMVCQRGLACNSDLTILPAMSFPLSIKLLPQPWQRVAHPTFHYWWGSNDAQGEGDLWWLKNLLKCEWCLLLFDVSWLIFCLFQIKYHEDFEKMKTGADAPHQPSNPNQGIQPSTM